jgi:hypothetical protein
VLLSQLQNHLELVNEQRQQQQLPMPEQLSKAMWEQQSRATSSQCSTPASGASLQGASTRGHWRAYLSMTSAAACAQTTRICCVCISIRRTRVMLGVHVSHEFI